jgi:hypothetical protein
MLADKIKVADLYATYFDQQRRCHPDEHLAFFAGFAACLMTLKTIAMSTRTEDQVSSYLNELCAECEDQVSAYINRLADDGAQSCDTQPAGM